MTDPTSDIRWRNFEEAGEVEVRMRLATHVYGEKNMASAREWLAYKESLRSAEANEATLAEAKSANELARAANDLASSANTIANAAAESARLSAEAAKTNNIIATIALIAAVIAMAISIVGIFVK
jgi:hypothetical protein